MARVNRTRGGESRGRRAEAGPQGKDERGPCALARRAKKGNHPTGRPPHLLCRSVAVVAVAVASLAAATLAAVALVAAAAATMRGVGGRPRQPRRPPPRGREAAAPADRRPRHLSKRRWAPSRGDVESTLSTEGYWEPRGGAVGTNARAAAAGSDEAARYRTLTPSCALRAEGGDPSSRVTICSADQSIPFHYGQLAS